MYITVGIDSEHYSDLGYGFYNTIEEARHASEEECIDCADIYSWGFDIENCGSESFIDRYYTDEEEYYWIVTEIHKADKKYNVVYWHAYDGVGFDVHSFDTMDEAKEFMKKEACDFVNCVGIENIISYYIDYNSATIDDDNEWHMWQIVEAP